MGIEIRVPSDDDWPAVCHADGRAFGFSYTEQERDERRPSTDLSRFRIACDAGEIVGIVGSYAFDVTLPGGATLPMGGVTWVSTAATHRRQGIVRLLMDALHRDIADRGEPLANLTASESSIYERFGYGIASNTRVAQISVRGVDVAEQHRQPAGAVRFMSEKEARDVVPALWDRYRLTRAGEVSRRPEIHDFILSFRARPDDGASGTFWLRHADGFASYRIADVWADGYANHELRLVELCALTPEAHAALWQTLLNVDLVATIKTRTVAEDDPLPFLLTDYRALRTTALNDGLWVKVLQPEVALATRTYATDDRLVVEITEGDAPGCYAIEGGPTGSACKSVRTTPDLTMSSASLGALLYGGVRPSRLLAGRRLEARNDDALRRADLFFPMAPLPYCITHY